MNETGQDHVLIGRAWICILEPGLALVIDSQVFDRDRWVVDVKAQPLQHRLLDHARAQLSGALAMANTNSLSILTTWKAIEGLPVAVGGFQIL